MFALSFVASATASSAAPTPTQWNVTVGGNTTTNGSLVFQPEEIKASIGDTVYFNFTQGNHTVMQSTFSAPCVWIDETEAYNGFTTGFRDAGNGTAITNYILPITSNDTIWFFDWNTCALGGVGGINVNESSTQTLAGFVRNAKRLNGTATSTSSSASHTGGSSGSSSTGSGSASETSTTSGAERNVVLGGLAAIPLIIAALAL
ncbi:uncharacterized protein C8Q71DRAFT_859769 [Rhodofomes roseus]|uniref:Phytocyanin domain-containing protein n=1 Tax=Rhodofomes roseus TaxID=34475 RepID=A0ABQ8K9P4_9APHY|nr:uncharacterized protein C8Q71DRAFT_859769 [Rhodofomes roseus]KAH9834101.1 hypothetical protein C8Q71DRAFT_859769 [Rhodofomes roseus]